MWDAVGSELVLFTCFLLGYMFFNWPQVQKRLLSKGGVLLEKQASADLASGNYADCLSKIAQLPLTAALLGMAVQALVEAKRTAEVFEYVENALLKNPALRSTEGLQAVLSALGSHGANKIA